MSNVEGLQFSFCITPDRFSQTAPVNSLISSWLAVDADVLKFNMVHRCLKMFLKNCINQEECFGAKASNIQWQCTVKTQK